MDLTEISIGAALTVTGWGLRKLFYDRLGVLEKQVAEHEKRLDSGAKQMEQFGELRRDVRTVLRMVVKIAGKLPGGAGMQIAEEIVEEGLGGSHQEKNHA